MSDTTARERFVEAMRQMWGALTEYHSLGYHITHIKWMEAACDAFADAECRFVPGGSVALVGACDDDHEHMGHRAAVRREVFGD